MRTQNNDPNTFETGKSILCGLIIRLHASKIHKTLSLYVFIKSIQFKIKTKDRIELTSKSPLYIETIVNLALKRSILFCDWSLWAKQAAKANYRKLDIVKIGNKVLDNSALIVWNLQN